MPSHRRRTALTLALGCLLIVPAGSSGHAQVMSVAPRPDAQLQRAPTAITIGFGEVIEGGADAIRLVDTAGRVRSGPTRVSGTRATAPVSGLGPGRYAWSYEITSADGHVIARSYAFAVGVRTPRAAPAAVRLGSRRVRVSGRRVGLRTIVLWPGADAGAIELRHPLLAAPLGWSIVDGRARGMLPFPGAYRLDVRAFDGFDEIRTSGTMTIAP
jgi:methionine-rich copper-binding protein CopC